MPPIIQAFVFVFGAAVGSFLNAVVWRLRTREDFIRGRSHCPSCHTTLSARDLVPIVSWIMLRGKCRYCRTSIAVQYVVVEVVVGLLFLLSALQAFSGAPFIDGLDLARLLLSWYVIAMMTIVFIYDLKYMLILRSVTFPATIIVAVANIALGVPVTHVLLGAIIGGGFFWLQRTISDGRWVGGGDVHLGFLMGAALGFPMILVALFLSYVTGAAVGVVMMAFRKVGWRSEIPFGTFLSVATVIAMLWGERILAWYLALL